MMRFDGKQIIIVGEGISGQGAFSALTSMGAECFFYASENSLKRKIDFAVVSPGVPLDGVFFKSAKDLNIPIIGEIELGFLLCNKPIIAVTGTNGKTTITELIATILRYDKKNPLVCGNIGVAFSSAVLENDYDVAVVEVSSFQLETISKFRPDIAIISNITDDHLDRHKTLADYAEAKFRITENQTENDYLVMPARLENLDCDGLCIKKLLGEVKSNIFYIEAECSSESGKTAAGCYINKDKIYFHQDIVGSTDDIGIKGEHNLENALMAIAACKLFGVNSEAISLGLKLFKPRAYRMALSGEHMGIKYYNDSKGTNIDACLCACRAMSGDTCLIVGGSDKGYDFDKLFLELPQNIVKIYSVGQTAEKICRSAERVGYINIEHANSIREATFAASKLKVAAVLLSPAAASFDSYANYEERGRDFDNTVGEIMQIDSKKWTI